MSEKISFFPFDLTYKIKDNHAVIYLYGKTAENVRICVTYPKFQPYFYVEPQSPEFATALKNIKFADAEIIDIQTVEKKFLGKIVKLLKVFTRLPQHVPIIKSQLERNPNVKNCYEYDILFTRRFLTDMRITPLAPLQATGNFVQEHSKVPVFQADELVAVKASPPQYQILSIDIETYNPDGKGINTELPILMIALFADDYKKVLTWKKIQNDDCEILQGEYEMLQRFKELLDKLKPDILTGYYSDGFDLPYIIARANKYNLKLDIGLDYSTINKEKRSEDVKITGIVHLDVFQFVKHVIGRSLKSGTYKLDDVAAELIGERKHVIDIENLAAEWDNNGGRLSQFAAYNLQDARVNFQLCKKLLPNIEELAKIIGLPLFDVSRMSFSRLVESYIINQTAYHNELVPNKPSESALQPRHQQTYVGGFVYQPTPGLYENVAVFDFRSLYPTIIISHNISPSSYKCGCCHDIIAETNDWFCKREKGFLPVVLEDIVARRARIKQLMKTDNNDMLEAQSNALKLLANSFYGYLGFAPARWYSFESAANVTALGRAYIQNVIGEAENSNFGVLYSDSIPFDRRIIVQTSNGDVKIMKIGELYNVRLEDNYKTLAYTESGQVVFRAIKRVIKHPYGDKGKLLRIIARYGTTVVTNQHSVYTYNNNEIVLAHAGKLKKGDYLISLTNPPVTVTYLDGHVFDIADFYLGDDGKELLLYKDNLQFQAKRGKCPYCGAVCWLAAHVHLKHNDRREAITKSSPFTFVGGTNAKGGRIPRYWKLDEELAWLLGFYCAEGSVSNVHTKSGRKLLLSFGGQDITLIKRVKAIIDTRLAANLKIIKDYDKRIKKWIYYYRVQRIPIVALFKNGFNAGQGSEFKRVPFFILSAEEKVRRAFLKGYLDGDGNSAKDKRYATHFIRFSTKSKDLAIGLDFLLKGLHHGVQAHGKEIKHVAWQYRKDKPKIQTLRLQSAKHSKSNFCLAEIRSIEEMKSEKFVYDLEVEGTHNFVDAEGMILVHNTDSIFLKLGNKTTEDAHSFVQRINAKLPGVMELDYEGFYPAALFVSAKASAVGAKKKYAMLNENGKLKIRGFETVRRNWSIIAKEVQLRVLEMLLKEKNKEKAVAYTKEIIRSIRAHKIPIEQMTIGTQLTRPVESYESVGPHVAVARRMQLQGNHISPGTIIHFVVAEGSGAVRDRAYSVAELGKRAYDAEYYINSQILPSVDRILAVVGIDIKQKAALIQQKSLAQFLTT